MQKKIIKMLQFQFPTKISDMFTIIIKWLMVQIVLIKQYFLQNPMVLFVFLRNLLTHTVNNLQQKLNCVKHNQYYAVKQNFKSIHIMCENFRTIPWVLCKVQLI